LLGLTVPTSLKMFLLAVAIIDDLLAIVVIAIFYAEELSTLALLLGAIGVAGLAALSLFDLRKPPLYVVVGALTWICVLKSGVHATLAGVAVGFAMPLTRNGGESLLEQVEYALKPWVSYARESAHSANRNTEDRLESVADRVWSKSIAQFG
jgi:Na+:H+ antiporter, NhaA family